MDQLVVDHVGELLVASVERNDDPILEELRYASDALAEVLIDDIRLLELIVGAIDHEGNALRNGE